MTLYLYEVADYTRTPRSFRRGCDDCRKMTWHACYTIEGVTVYRCRDCKRETKRKGAVA